VKKNRADRRGPHVRSLINAKGYEGVSAIRLESDLTVEGHLPQHDGDERGGEAWERAEPGWFTGGDGKRRRGCRTAAELLLGHPGPAAGRGSVGIAGNTRCSGSSASSSELDGESENGAKVV
jgi:hypothetical protein